ncbi:hypothetical protein Salat_0505100 [Sesamum alatum]|uniref:Uncharacterized protein n=1 Tax=Sesamum alatum TaxID=300844 RepID=A0AAE1Z4B1_9LAMI|nr:hypothetical protein Salat_0505100 [Sesamum alatum]
MCLFIADIGIGLKSLPQILLPQGLAIWKIWLKDENPTCRIRTSDLRISANRLQSSALPTELRSDACCQRSSPVNPDSKSPSGDIFKKDLVRPFSSFENVSFGAQITGNLGLHCLSLAAPHGSLELVDIPMAEDKGFSARSLTNPRDSFDRGTRSSLRGRGRRQFVMSGGKRKLSSSFGSEVELRFENKRLQKGDV